MGTQCLLAKKSLTPDNPKEGETLLGHSRKVAESFQIMFGENSYSPTELSKSWLCFFKLSSEVFPKFWVNGIVACFLHDLGKANSGFQNMLGARKELQVLPHEQISGFLALCSPIRDIVKIIPNVDENLVFGAIVSHHLRCSENIFLQPQNSGIKVFKFFPWIVKEIFSELFLKLGISFSEFSWEFQEVWDFESSGVFNPQNIWSQNYKRAMAKISRAFKKEPASNSLLMAVRSGLIVADSSGSGLLREGKNLRDWLSTAFSTCLSGSYLEHHVIEPRISHIRQEEGHFSWNDFQIAMDIVPSRALLLASCGSGKTLAAWRWIKAQVEKRRVSRVLFLYPTRATATEGFRDYISWAPESEASLMHSTASYDLEGMFDDVFDDRQRKNFTLEKRLFALGCWHRGIFSATVDQFLGFMQQNYAGICLLPLLAESVVVFDEIHSFDKSLFSAFKLFLKNFDLPALCMTASLPPSRCEELQNECGLSLFPCKKEKFPELEAKSQLPRYKVELLNSSECAEDLVLKKWNSGKAKKILWVVNTVARCQHLARKFSEGAPTAICYHSRFKLEDRNKKHQELIARFQTKDERILAITTQVCEMSLDIDADFLITETAPIPSLIQRMGRCNRHAHSADRLGLVCLYNPEETNPYDKNDLAALPEFLSEISGKTITQEKLSHLLDQYGSRDVEIEKYSAFLENGLWAVGREESLRDETNFTVQAILDADIPQFVELRSRKMPPDGLMVPVPRKLARQSRLGRFPLVAPGTHYHPDTGFWDAPLPEIIGGNSDSLDGREIW